MLELSHEEMRRFGYRVVDLLADHFQDTAGPVGKKASPSSIRPLLDAPPPRLPSDPHELLTRLERDVFPNNLRVDHPRFFAFVPGPNNFISAMGDALAAGLNIFNGTWMGGSAAAALELTVIGWLREFCGLPESAGGLFVSGGSVANVTALVAARHALLDDEVAGATVYCSDQTHSSVDRALRVIGFRAQQLRKLPSNDRFELEPQSLREAIRKDRTEGLRPFCAIVNAGSTNTGAVDPIDAVADVCEEEKLWLHADGAFGAAAVLCERGRAELKGLGRVDSLSLDPHKWLFQSFECGCVLVKDARQLKAAFQIMPEYLRDVHRGEGEVHPCDYGMQLTRSFRALKVWLSLSAFGTDAFAHAITRGFELAELAEREIRTRGWEVVTLARMGIVSFRVADDDELHTLLVDEMLRDGYAFLTSTVLRGRTCLRLCTINPRTTDEDIKGTVERLERFAAALKKCSPRVRE